MKRIGITGQNGFIGQHLYNTLGLFPKEFTCVEFKKSYFDDENALQKFVNSCDVIVHLAALNRDSNPQNIYTTNILLVNKLIKVLSKKTTKTHLLFSSSLQEEQSNLYGKSKKEGRELFIKWARETNNTFTGLVVPNVFGPFGKPFYNSFIATFCHLLVQNSEPTIEKDSEVNLIYVLELINYILEQIRSNSHLEFLEVPSTTTKKVSEVLEILQDFKNNYFDLGIIPNLPTPFHKNLFNTYRSYIDYPSIFLKSIFFIQMIEVLS